MRMTLATLAVTVVAGAAFALAQPRATPPRPPIEPPASARRAAAYLTREVPRWRREHPCYSCHNNGDAARALIALRHRGINIGDSLSDTLTFLARPDRWDGNAKGGGVEDTPLMRIQFASALAAAVERGLAPRPALVAAAEKVAADQHADGFWKLDSSESLGSPAAYGITLATAVARRVLARAADARLSAAEARADRWLRSVDAVTVLDASAVIIGLGAAADDAADAAASARAQRQRCLDVIRRGQGPDGGWGPYVSAASEPFDTAIALLALASVPTIDERAALVRGREYLLRQQREDGSWDETTRPARQESYAQRISTTGWATLALLETERVAQSRGGSRP